MFDALNSKTKFDKNPKKCGLTKDNAARQALENGLRILQDLKKIVVKGNLKKNTTPPCFEGLQQSINGIILLYTEENTEGVQYLLTNRLNQDVLENLFSTYRLKGGNNKNPSARMLRSVFRSYLTEMLVRLPGHQNCEQTDVSNCDLSDNRQNLTKEPEPEPQFGFRGYTRAYSKCCAPQHGPTASGEGSDALHNAHLAQPPAPIAQGLRLSNNALSLISQDIYSKQMFQQL